MPLTMATRVCECEHASHFDHGGRHAYGARCALTETRVMETPHGPFIVCAECVRDGHPRVEIG
jgi:hypothetical protein